MSGGDEEERKGEEEEEKQQQPEEASAEADGIHPLNLFKVVGVRNPAYWQCISYIAPNNERKKWKTSDAVGTYCRVCKKTIPYHAKKNSKAVTRHMDRVHKDLLESFEKKDIRKRKSCGKMEGYHKHKKAMKQLLANSSSEKEENVYKYNPTQFLKSYKSLRNELTPYDPDQDTTTSSTETKRRELGGGRKKLTVAAIQQSSTSSSSAPTSSSNDADNFLRRAVQSVETAVKEHNATLVLLQELFLGPYFCQSQEAKLFGLADVLDDGLNQSPLLSFWQGVAKRLDVVLPISMFERLNNAYYNSVVMIDSDGSILGTYRKTHIPDGTGYQEKFYFSPGDTGFKVFETSVGKVGVAICWDQWFPEAARSMALMGADVLLYPTAIGSEPQDPTLDSSDHWQRVMQGHAAANMVPVVASNRYGTEILLDDEGNEKQRISFYGRSFITDETGRIVEEAADGDDILVSVIDAEQNRATRVAWGLFRDRRPDLYDVLKTKDGKTPIA